jgi:hypothetical protein
MAKNKKSKQQQNQVALPNNVRQVLFRTILDFKRAYDLDPENAQERIEFFERVLNEDEINIFIASELFSHFTQLQEFSLAQTQNPNMNQKPIKSLIKDSEIILNYMNQSFKIIGNSEGRMITYKEVA